MNKKIRLAAQEDAPDILGIYTPIVSNTTISFEVIPPSLQEMQQRMEQVLSSLPWLVCEDQQGILGYSYASVHRGRAAYRWSVNTSIYVHERARRCGIARALYTSLFSILVLQGYYNAFAAISLPNPPSVTLHEAMGFEQIGVYHKVGYLMDAWHDVGWWQLSLQKHVPFPEEPRSLATVMETPEWGDALAAGLSALHL